MSATIEWRDQTVLVPGASGFLGSHLCRRLADYGAKVVGVSRAPRQSTGGPIQWLQVDLGDLDGVRRLLRAVKPDVIFHLSGCATASPGLEYIIPTFESFVRSTVNLLVAATECGCRRVIVPGSLTEPEPTQAFPGSPYAAAKGTASMYARMFFGLYGTPVVMPRVFMTYGPGQDCNKVIPYVIHCLLRDEAPKLTQGRWQLDWIYIDDVIEGLLAAAIFPGLEGETVDLGTGIVTSVRGIVERLERIIGSRAAVAFGAYPDRPAEGSRVANVTEAKIKLRWEAVTRLDAGLRATVDWYRRRLESEERSAASVGQSAQRNAYGFSA